MSSLGGGSRSNVAITVRPWSIVTGHRARPGPGEGDVQGALNQVERGGSGADDDAAIWQAAI